MNASSQDKPNILKSIPAPAMHNAPPTAIKTDGSFDHRDKSSGGGR